MAAAVETVKNFMNVLKKYSQDSSQVGQLAPDDAKKFAEIKNAASKPDWETVIKILEG